MSAYWNVMLRWRGDDPRFTSWEAGGHTVYELGDTPMEVIAAVAKGRGVDLAKCYEVTCRLIDS